MAIQVWIWLLRLCRRRTAEARAQSWIATPPRRLQAPRWLAMTLGCGWGAWTGGHARRGSPPAKAELVVIGRQNLRRTPTALRHCEVLVRGADEGCGNPGVAFAAAVLAGTRRIRPKSEVARLRARVGALHAMVVGRIPSDSFQAPTARTVPAWGSAPGRRRGSPRAVGPRINGPTATPQRQCARRMGRAFSPLVFRDVLTWGCAPGWDGPRRWRWLDADQSGRGRSVGTSGSSPREPAARPSRESGMARLDRQLALLVIDLRQRIDAAQLSPPHTGGNAGI